MQVHVPELVGIAAALASLYAAYARTMVLLRAAAIVAGALAVVYGLLEAAYPTAVFAAVLILINGWRLNAMLKLTRGIAAAAGSDLNSDWLLPYTHPKRFKAGDVVIKRGDYATAAFYIVSGEAEIVESGETMGQGTLIGEIGLFAPDGRRTLTIRCRTDVEAAQIDYDQFKELYFQNPEFGFSLLHLIVGRLQASPETPRPALRS
jgi:hypothetical protein